MKNETHTTLHTIGIIYFAVKNIAKSVHDIVFYLRNSHMGFINADAFVTSTIEVFLDFSRDLILFLKIQAHQTYVFILQRTFARYYIYSGTIKNLAVGCNLAKLTICAEIGTKMQNNVHN